MLKRCVGWDIRKGLWCQWRVCCFKSRGYRGCTPKGRYIYTNPLSVADCAAAEKAIDIADSTEGLERLTNVRARIKQFRDGLQRLGYETIPGVHPVVPLMVRDTEKTKTMVESFFQSGVLVVGLNFPVVPKGDQSIRFQINAAHTEKDIAMLDLLDAMRSA